MESKIYLKPVIKVLDTYSEELMFEPGGGVSEANPGTPSVNSAKEFDDDVWNDSGNAWGMENDDWDSSEDVW